MADFEELQAQLYKTIDSNSGKAGPPSPLPTPLPAVQVLVKEHLQVPTAAKVLQVTLSQEQPPTLEPSDFFATEWQVEGLLLVDGSVSITGNCSNSR